MKFETEQKLSYKNHSTQSNTPITCLPLKSNCVRDSLKFDYQYPFETIQHSSYKEWILPNNTVSKKPKDCIDLSRHGPMNLNTTQQIDYKRRMIPQKCKIFII